MRKRYPQGPERRPADRRNLLARLLLTAFVVGGLGFGYLFYASVRDIVAYSALPFLLSSTSQPGIVSSAGTFGSAPGSFAMEPTVEEATERINILLLGIDEREAQGGPSRTDTMILFSIDPISKTAAMLSIPRDLWVSLPPGLPYNIDDRINTAHFYGDLYKYPGGGPELAKRSVQDSLGVPVDYYVRINFQGFQRIIDDIGGIDVDVPSDMVDDKYPTADGEVMTVHFSPGRQHMDGDTALEYARIRHGGTDIDRTRRQQQVILAVRDKVQSLDIPLTRIPSLLQTLGDSVRTDLPLATLLSLAKLSHELQAGGIEQGVIDESMVIFWKMPSGAEVLLPQSEKIRALVNQLFPVSP